MSLDAKKFRDILNDNPSNDVRGISFRENNDILTCSTINVSKDLASYFLDDNNICKMKFTRVQCLSFDKTLIRGFKHQVNIREDLRFLNEKFLTALDLQNVNFLSTTIAGLNFNVCKNLTSVTNISASNILRICFSETVINKIHFARSNQDVSNINIIDSTCHNVFENLLGGKISNLYIVNSEFRKFTKHYAKNIETAYIDCRYIDNFRNVDSFKVSQKLKLQCMHTLDNIINLLNNTCESIVIDPFESISKPANIVRLYLNIGSLVRKDYIMDCALTLIDNGFEMAAEL